MTVNEKGTFKNSPLPSLCISQQAKRFQSTYSEMVWGECTFFSGQHVQCTLYAVHTPHFVWQISSMSIDNIDSARSQWLSCHCSLSWWCSWGQSPQNWLSHPSFPKLDTSSGAQTLFVPFKPQRSCIVVAICNRCGVVFDDSLNGGAVKWMTQV